MNSYAGSFTYSALNLGQIAAALLQQSRQGQADGKVEAVFSSTFYIQLRGGFICIGHVGLEPGPLNCVTSAPAAIDWKASGIKVGTKVSVSAREIRVGNTFQFPVTDYQCWQPARRPSPDARALSHGVELFRQAIECRSELDGLGYFSSSDSSTMSHQLVCLAARRLLFNAHRWLYKAFQEPRAFEHDPAPWAQQLCGLGPGLTPSGDDFLCGVMIALHLLDEVELKHHLWRSIESQARNRTNAISLAHLSAAASGFEGARLHRMVSAIAEGRSDEIARTVDDVSRVGHSSGWDIMAGIITTLEAWLQVLGARSATEVANAV